jgi:hypothetical protein
VVTAPTRLSCGAHSSATDFVINAVAGLYADCLLLAAEDLADLEAMMRVRWSTLFSNHQFSAFREKILTLQTYCLLGVSFGKDVAFAAIGISLS